MKATRKLFALSVAMGLIAVTGLFLARSVSPPVFAQTSTNPNANVPPFDFSDPFYTENGIDVIKLDSVGRVGFDGANAPGSSENGFTAPPNVGNWTFDNSNTDPTRTNVRVLQTTGGFEKDGNLIYYQIMAPVPDDGFFSDAKCPTDFSGCGTRLNTLGNEFRAFLSPKQFKNGVLIFPDPSSCKTVDTGAAGVNPILVTSTCASNSAPLVFSPAPGNRRQDNVFDTQNTYFCQNLVGLWILAFVVYTPQAYLPNGQFASAAAQAAIAPIAAANGISLDGTAVLKRTSEIDSLAAQGFVQEFVMPRTVHTGAPRYVV